MRLRINGEETEIAAAASLAELVAGLGLRERRIAIELNREVVQREQWQSTPIREHDEVEIVQFVGGG